MQRFTPAAGRDRARDTILRDGSPIRIREASEADVPAIVEFLEGLDPESRRLRFAAVGGDLVARARAWASPGQPGDCSLLAETLVGGRRRVIGSGTCLRVGATVAEAAFAVADEWQGMGVATLLLETLAQRASEAGVTSFVAEVLVENARMLQVFRASGFPLRLRSEPGAVRVEFPTEMSGGARQSLERREQEAAAAAVRALLHPASVAVISGGFGAGTAGGDLLHNIRDSGFGGPLHAVAPADDAGGAAGARRSLGEVEGAVDLALIALPPDEAIEAARACGAKGVRTVVVVSPGFAEAGPEGAGRQRDLAAICRDAGMRLAGPNCMGVMCLEPGARLNASLIPALPSPGRVALFSQSGALGLAIIGQARRRGLGLSSFVSVGNKADLSGNDFLAYWEGDPSCGAIAMHLESVGNPRKFTRIARRVGRRKPIVVLRGGRSAAGSRASLSHTGARVAASEVTVDALFRQAGVVRTDTLAEFLDAAALLADAPLPPGRNVAILTNGGGPGILAADACEAGGLTVAPIPDPVRRRLAGLLPPAAALGNPVDTADAPPRAYAEALRVLAACEDVHAVIAIFGPTPGADVDAIASAVAEVAGPSGLSGPPESAGGPSGLPGEPSGSAGSSGPAGPSEASGPFGGRIPVLAVPLAADDTPGALRGGSAGLPAFTFPEDAARALAHAARHAEWRRAPEGRVPELAGLDADEAATVIARALARPAGAPAGPAAAPGDPAAAPGDGVPSRWLDPDEVAGLLGAYGIELAAWRLADGPEEAGAAAAELGGRVALKAIAAGLVRKRDASAVALGLEGADRVVREARAMAARLAAVGHPAQRLLVQRMVPAGVEMLVGVVHDPLFGPVIACGAGDSEIDLLRDVSVRITPLTDRDAAEMLRSLAMFPQLEGYRTSGRSDVAALEGLLLRISAMVEAHPEIVELDCNPVMALPEGAVVIDARVRVGLPGLPAASQPDVPRASRSSRARPPGR